MTTTFEMTSRLADYFVVSGLDVSSGLEPDKLSGDNLHCPPLDRPFKSKVLAHYPDNVPGNPFDQDAVGMLSLPKGLIFRTHRQKRINKFHTFLITREDGSRIYGATYTFYEEVKNRQICAAMKTLHSMHLAELSNDQSRTLYSPVGSPYSPGTPKTVRKLKELEKKNKLFDYNTDSLFVTKCLTVLTSQPFVDCLHKFLSSLYELCTTDSPPVLAIESYVYNILHEIPLASPGKSLTFKIRNQTIMCQRPGVNELPLFDFSLQEVFKLLGVENFVNVFTSLLLEHQILLYSEEYYKLMLVSESLSTLMFPFTWQHVYVPILPASMLHFLDAPVPFVMGIHQSADDKAPVGLPTEGSVCIVDIDKSRVSLPEDLPDFPNKYELMEEICKILKQYGIDDKFDYNSLERRKKNRPHSFENDSGMSSNDESSLSGSIHSIPSKMDILQNNDAMARITALAMKTGVISSFDDLHDVINDNQARKYKISCASSSNLKVESSDTHVKELKFNNALREIFLNRFMHVFLLYEEFIIQPTETSIEAWLANRESTQNYDRASFLSDQPDTHLPFLSPFIETQMFTTFIDNKILSKWEDPDPCVKLFEARLKPIKDRFGESRTPTYYSCTAFKDTETLIEKRAHHIDLIACEPHALDMTLPTQHKRGFFPHLNGRALNVEPDQEIVNDSKRNNSSKWRKKKLQPLQMLLHPDKEKHLQSPKTLLPRQPKLTDISKDIVKTNWKFVETLLKEVKFKTKRMLVEKMGQEAVDLGHGELTVTGIEENTLIASLSDLLERIWNHGLQQKQGKCALWSHFLNFQETQECHDNAKPIDPKLLSPDISALALEGDNTSPPPPVSPQKEYNTGSLTRPKRRPSKGPELPSLPPLSVSILADMRNIKKITELKTDIGYARAWVRLALEKKVLSKHLKELTADQDLLKTLYKRYAFLRCEDEREQFIYHLLSLNAVDYRCFTNTYTSAKIPYRILIFPGKSRFQGYYTTANVWISLAGQLGETNIISVPKNSLELLVEHKNLGVLTTLRIGHDNNGMSPKWMVEHVLVRNEITGHMYRFPCGRWLGKGVDDSSIERLLVGELMPASTNSEDLLGACSTPPRSVSPNMPRKASSSSDIKLKPADITQMFGDAVNSIVKYFYKPEKERGSLTVLLCGELGVVYCLELVFNQGFRSSRLFRNKFYIWDFLEKNMWHFENALRDHDSKMSDTQRAVYESYCDVVSKINGSSSSVGKDGKFQLFVCIGLRDHLIQPWFQALHRTIVTANMYEENSFLRNPELFNQILQLLKSVGEFKITLEPSLMKASVKDANL